MGRQLDCDKCGDDGDVQYDAHTGRCLCSGCIFRREAKARSTTGLENHRTW